MKEKTVQLIKRLGNGHNELVFDMYLEMGKFDTIEYKDGQIILHIFEKYDYDITFDYDFLSEEDKLIILSNLKDCLASE